LITEPLLHCALWTRIESVLRKQIHNTAERLSVQAKPAKTLRQPPAARTFAIDRLYILTPPGSSFLYQKTQKNHKHEYNLWYFADTSSESASKKHEKGKRSEEINQLSSTDVRDRREKLSSTELKANRRASAQQSTKEEENCQCTCKDTVYHTPKRHK